MKKLMLALAIGVMLAGLGAFASVATADHPPKPVPGGTVMTLTGVERPPEPPSPISSIWHEESPKFSHLWHLTSWKDRDGDERLSKGDWVDLRRVKRRGKDFGPRNFATVVFIGHPRLSGLFSGDPLGPPTLRIEIMEGNPRPPRE